MTTLHSSFPLVRQWLSSAPAILALALAATACGPADDRPPPPSIETEESASDLKEDEDRDRDDDEDDDDPRTSRSCEEGDAKECQIKLPKQGSVQNCIEGVRYCENGAWGPCEVD